MEILRTNRLILEHATCADVDFIFELVNTPKWINYIGDKDIKTKDNALLYIENSLMNSYVNNGFGLYKMTLIENKTAIGLCGFMTRDYLEHADIGYAILPNYENKGYTTEAAIATLTFGKEELKMKTILAITTADNTSSRRLLDKIGLLEIDKITPDGSNEELLMYST
jgi:RimJ/RimL family protein N-acetyltransferase